LTTHDRRTLGMIELTDHDILLRLTSGEDSTVERKTASDYNDCRKTAVAFSNSLPVDDPGIIFVGVYDDGRVQDGNNVESLQKKVSERISRIYPPIFAQFKVMEKEGKEFLAVIVRGSPKRPHFAGPAYVRDGSESVEASDKQFAELISQRNSMAYALLKWKGKYITLDSQNQRIAIPGYRPRCMVLDCNQFFLTLQGPNSKHVYTFPLSEINLAFDHNQNRLEIRIKQ
jgi:hypothetical protein